jgi:hypothetical protein
MTTPQQDMTLQIKMSDTPSSTHRLRGADKTSGESGLIKLQVRATQCDDVQFEVTSGL